MQRHAQVPESMHKNSKVCKKLQKKREILGSKGKLLGRHQENRGKVLGKYRESSGKVTGK